MPTPETPLQHNMFSGEAVDRRTTTQKRSDKKNAQPKQQLMFSQREIGQFGVNAKPLLPLSPHMKLPMMVEDPRTEEEKEADLQREAEENTLSLFPLEPKKYKVEQVSPLFRVRVPIKAPVKEVVIFSSESRLRIRKGASPIKKRTG